MGPRAEEILRIKLPGDAESNTTHLGRNPITARRAASPWSAMTKDLVFGGHPKSVGIRPTQERAICESVLPPGQLRRKG